MSLLMPMLIRMPVLIPMPMLMSMHVAAIRVSPFASSGGVSLLLFRPLHNNYRDVIHEMVQMLSKSRLKLTRMSSKSNPTEVWMKRKTNLSWKKVKNEKYRKVAKK